MAAFNIPLAGKAPQIQPPAQVLGQVLDVEGLADQHNLRLQQQKANDLAMQQHAMDMASQKALNQAIQGNLKPDGTLDHNGVVSTLGKQGWGTVGVKYGQEMQKYLAEQAKVRAEQIEGDKKALEQVSQGLNGVNDDPSYQTVKPVLAQQLQKWGVQVPLPATYDPIAIGRLKALGTTARDALTAQKDANDLARWQATDLRTGVGAFEKEYLSDLKDAHSQPDLDRINQKFRAITNAVPQQYRDGYTAVLNSSPNTWTAEVPKQAFDRLTTPAQTIQQKEADARLAETSRFHEESQQTRMDVAKLNSETRKEIADQNAALRRDIAANKPAPGADARQKYLDSEAAKHDAFDAKEQEQWQLHGAIGDVLKLKNGTKFYDPTAKMGSQPLEMDASTRQRLAASYDKAETTANGLKQQKQQILKRHGWGEFAQQPPAQPAAAPASPTATATARPQAKGPDGHIIEWDGSNWVDPKTGKSVK